MSTFKFNKTQILVLFLILTAASSSFAAGSGQTGADTTLWKTLVDGGMVMIFIGLLSLLAVAIIVYDLMTLHPSKLTPRKFFDDLIKKLESKDVAGAKELCVRENNNLLSKIVLDGLDKAKWNPRAPEVKEAMEQRARFEIGYLWQNVNYLSDIVAVAPLLGLLGTVLGMIQAFHAVPVQSAGVKTALLAAGISKAMIATAAGLIVAIPSLMAYSYFRGKVLEVTNSIEKYCTDIIKQLESC